jgi:aspartate/methionine/tyrosine aminotransferase
VRLVVPDGAFYLFFAVEGEADSRALAIRLLREAKVGLSPGTAFGPGGEGYLRLCFAGSHDRLSTALDRLVPALS